MTTLTRYLLARLAVRFVFLLVVFLGVLVGGQFGIYVGRGAPPDVLAPVALSMVLMALPIALPLALASAVLVVVGAMSRDGEFQALAAAGISPLSVVLRAWPMMLAGSLACAALMHLVMPMAVGGIRANQGRILQAMIAQRVVNLAPIWDDNGVSVRAAHVEGRTLDDVWLLRYRGEATSALFAPQGSWNIGQESMRLELIGAQLIQDGRNGEFAVGTVDRLQLRKPIDGGMGSQEPDAMRTGEVLALMERERAAGHHRRPVYCSRYNNSRLTIQFRLYMPVAVIAWCLFGAGLALVLASGETLFGVALVVGVVTLTAYPAFGYVKSNADTPHLHPAWFFWWAPPLLTLAGWWMLTTPETARELLARPFGLIRNRLWRPARYAVVRVRRRLRR